MNSPDCITVLDRRNYKKIADTMLGSMRREIWGTTFTNLMQDLRGTNPPEIYALTAQSAIPIADAIRSYHETLALPEPTFTTVNANRSISRASETKQADATFIEACRLEHAVRQKTVALIDQYVGCGSTIELGRSMLRCAGARGIRSDENIRWYDQAVPSDIDIENMTSEHADFMLEIGQKAAKAHALFTP